MKNEPINLGEKRAYKHNDNSAWTPLEMLQKMCRDIESGDATPEQMIVVYWEPSEDGEGFFPCRVACNVSRQEELAMLAICKDGLMNGWLRGEYE